MAAKNQQQDRTIAGTKFHAKEDMSRQPYTWTMTEEEETLGTHQSARLLTRTLIGKVNNRQTLETTLKSIPVRAGQEGHDGWNCVAWVKEAVEELAEEGNDALCSSMLDWPRIRAKALEYTREKVASHRFDGKPATYKFVQEDIPTYDMVTDKEIVR